MTLDLVIPTLNRRELLRKALESVFRASVPDDLSVRVIVVDNQSTDGTKEMVLAMQAEAPLPLLYVVSPERRSSTARNAGVKAGSSDLIGFIDDDEELFEDWLEVAAREFADPEVHFIGGPYFAKWEAPAPDWLPPGYPAVIGAMPVKPRSPYSNTFPGVLTGGNAVMRRSVFAKVGMFSNKLGRTPKGLLSEEDAEFYQRLLAAGIQGIYVPELAVHHHVPANRLTRNYHRRWAFWRAVSQGLHDRDVREKVTYLLGLPRHRIGGALRGLVTMPRDRFRPGAKGRAFAAELACWELVGFIYGKFFFAGR